MANISNHPEKAISSNTTKKIPHVYDKIFKKILTLSNRAVVGLINGLFHTDYPPDSTISYNWTEHLDDDLNRTIADTILTINYTHSYHLEAQMYDDEEIELRVFDYGYRHALKASRKRNVLHFPEPQIICLHKQKHIPDTTILTLDFGPQGSFEYTVPIYNLLQHTPEELSQRKMIILIPFMLLKLKDSIKKERTPENMEALRTLILDDIINLIQNNQDAGNITISDANRLRSLIRKLYNHLYSHYDEFIEGGFNDMMEDGLVLDVDIIEAELTKKVTKRVTKEVTEQVTQQVTQQVTKQVTQQVTKQVTKQVTQQNQKDTICKLYSKLNDTAQVADLLDIPVDTVKEAIRQ